MKQIKHKPYTIILGITILLLPLLLLGGLIWAVSNLYSPIVLKIRPTLMISIFLVHCIAIYFIIRQLYKPLSVIPTFLKLHYCFLAICLLINCSLIPASYLSRVSNKNYVLNANTPDIEYYGRHFVVGYSDYNSVEQLVKKSAIGGIFISSDNIKDKTFEQVQQEIQNLQDIRKSQNKPPLFISTDQEGGLVSRLSPLIHNPKGLTGIVNDAKTSEERKQAVQQFATGQAQQLNKLGINLNFAPVVDLKPETTVLLDKYSLISLRAISNDPAIVSEVGLQYSQILEKNKVLPTLKHFPGIGRADADTHLFDSIVTTSYEELERADLIPFKTITTQSNAVVMLSHITLSQIDKDNPVSISNKIVNDIIRNKWNHNGVLITDDFSMAPIYHGEGGISAATIKALNAGVDLILISYDYNLYYESMYALLTQNSNRINTTMTDKSHKRLDAIVKVFE